jgi:hypothetical protein
MNWPDNSGVAAQEGEVRQVAKDGQACAEASVTRRAKSREEEAGSVQGGRSREGGRQLRTSAHQQRHRTRQQRSTAPLKFLFAAAAAAAAAGDEN